MDSPSHSVSDRKCRRSRDFDSAWSKYESSPLDTPLENATRFADPHFVKLLIQNGAVVNAPGAWIGERKFYQDKNLYEKHVDCILLMYIFGPARITTISHTDTDLLDRVGMNCGIYAFWMLRHLRSPCSRVGIQQKERLSFYHLGFVLAFIYPAFGEFFFFNVLDFMLPRRVFTRDEQKFLYSFGFTLAIKYPGVARSMFNSVLEFMSYNGCFMSHVFRIGDIFADMKHPDRFYKDISIEIPRRRTTCCRIT